MNAARDVSDLQTASERLQTFSKRHNRAALLMAVPIVAGFVLEEIAPFGFGGGWVGIGCALGLTVGVCDIPTAFRSRSGSLTPAIGLVAAMWLMAIGVVVLALV